MIGPGGTTGSNTGGWTPPDTSSKERHMNDELLRDDDAPIGADSDFWYDAHSIPQYELLVREGRVTQEQADMHRRGRAEMGLPMTFAELKPRPHPRFTWLLAAGGPSITGDGERIEIDGRQWRASAWSTDDRPGTLSHYDELEEKDGYLHRELHTPHEKKEGVRWSASYKLPAHDKRYARVSGQADTFSEAMAQVLAVDFHAGQAWGGTTWYPNEYSGWIAVVDDNELTVAYHPWVQDVGLRWRWEVRPAEGTILRRIAELFSDYRLAGSSASQEEAAAAALAAPAQLRVLAAELLAVNAGSEYERGRQAGRAEVKARITALL